LSGHDVIFVNTSNERDQKPTRARRVRARNSLAFISMRPMFTWGSGSLQFAWSRAQVPGRQITAPRLAVLQEIDCSALLTPPRAAVSVSYRIYQTKRTRVWRGGTNAGSNKHA